MSGARAGGGDDEAGAAGAAGGDEAELELICGRLEP